MKKHIPNFVTSLNLLTGAIGCLTVATGDPKNALSFIILCGILDFADGLVARMLQVTSKIGKELDSLADVISFGLLPALTMAKFLNESTSHELLPYVALLIAVFSAIRLAKFNVDEEQSDKFIGLPTPANAVMISSIYLLPPSISENYVALIAISLISCFLLVSPIDMIALKFKGLGWKKNSSKYLLLLIVVIIFATFQLKGVPYVVPAYILISVIWNFAGSESVKS